MKEPTVVAGEVYQHYKKVVDGKPAQYRVVCVARHSETMEDLVIYEALYPNETKFWARPLTMFLEIVAYEGQKVERFKKV
jgi:hypothetical protein